MNTFKAVPLLIILIVGIQAKGMSQSFFQQQMDISDSKYEQAYQKVSTSYNFLINLQLYNKENIKLLDTYRESVKKQVAQWVNVDYSVPSNLDKALKVINQYYTDNQYIKDEINLLEKVSIELDNLKQLYPATFTSTDRYKELISIINVLQNCEPNEIRTIGIKHGIL